MVSLLADLVALVHGLFVVFVVFGGLLVLRWPRGAWLHLPCVAWGVAVELTGWACPLTPLEIWLRGSLRGPGRGFLATYLHPLLYPAWLTPTNRWMLAGIVVLINASLYGWLVRRTGDPSTSET